MKKIIIALLLSLFTLSQAATDTDHRSSLYLRSSLGTSFDNVVKDFDYIYGDFSGTSETIEFDLGINIRHIMAIYWGIDFSAGSGSWEYSRYYKDADASHYTFNLNLLGVSFYPFRSSKLRGFLFGVSFGFGGEFVNDDENETYIDEPVWNTRLEIGHVWDVSRRISLGVTSQLTLKSFLGDYDNGEFSAYSLGLEFTVMRR
ncbi:MAG: hypothetical protein MJY85_04330 [Fibrobacter sp.]|nr:hypothetical protein [Fibrobacter sp.]